MIAACSATLRANSLWLCRDFVGQHAQGRLQRMGQVSDLRAGAFDHFRVRLNEQIELLGDGADLFGIVRGQPLLLAGTDGCEFTLEFAQGAQTIVNLDQQSRQQTKSKQCQHKHQRVVERLHLGTQFVEIACNEEGIELRTAIEGVRLLNDFQPRSGRVRHVEVGDAVVVPLAQLLAGRHQTLLEQGRREQSLVQRPADRRVICQYHPCSGSLNRVSASAPCIISEPSSVSSTLASRPSRTAMRRASKLRSTACWNR
jgi:hypothetical protein